MKSLFFAFVLFLGARISGKAQQDTTSILKTHWLIGSWKGETKQGAFYETWRKKADNSLVCYSVSIKNGDTSAKINSIIRWRDSVVVFEDPQVWKAIRLMANDMTFELLTAKGKHRIIWIKTTDNHWWAILQFPSATINYDLVNMPALDKAIDKYLPD